MSDEDGKHAPVVPGEANTVSRFRTESTRERAGGDLLSPLRTGVSIRPTKSLPSRPRTGLRLSAAVPTPPRPKTPGSGSGSGMRFTFDDGTPVGSVRHMPTMADLEKADPTGANADSLAAGASASAGAGKGKFARAARLAATLSRGSSFMASTKSLLQAGSKYLVRKRQKPAKQQIKTSTQIMSEKLKYLQSVDVLQKSTRSWHSSRERASKSEQRRPCLVLRPQSPVRLGWDLVTLFLLLYIAVATPFQIGFSVDATGFLFWLEKVVDVFFIVDLCLNFRTGYVSPNGEEVLEPCKIAKAYLTGWFWIDLMSSIPFDFVFAGLNDLRSAKMLKAGRVVKALRVVRLTKLVRFLKLAVFIEKLEENFSINRNLLQLVKLLLGTVVMCHFFACMWFFFGTLEETPYGWVWQEGVQDHSPGSQYLTSFYWAVATLATVGYGDVVPVTNTERTFAIIGMLLGGGYFGYIIATMASLVSKLDASTAAYHNKMDAIVSYMKSRNLPRDLQMRIRKYYKHYLEKKTAFDESAMLSELSTFLRQEVAMFLINDTLFKIPIFRGRDPTFVADLITVLKPLTCSEGDFIMREGEFGREMFVLIRGELEVLHDGHPLALLGPGSYFGEMSVLYQEHSRRQATIRAVTYCEMYSLSRDDLLYVCRDHQSVLDEMRNIAVETYEQLKRQRELVSRDDASQIDASLLLHRGAGSSSDDELDERDLSRGPSMFSMPSANDGGGARRGSAASPSSKRRRSSHNRSQVAPAPPATFVLSNSNVDSKAHPTLVGAMSASRPAMPDIVAVPVSATSSLADADAERRSPPPPIATGNDGSALTATPAARNFAALAYKARRNLSALEDCFDSFAALTPATGNRPALRPAGTPTGATLLLPTGGGSGRQRSRSRSVVGSERSRDGLPGNYSNLSVSAGDVSESVHISTSARGFSRSSFTSHREGGFGAATGSSTRSGRRRSVASPNRLSSTASHEDRLRATLAARYEVLRHQVEAMGQVVRRL